MASTVHYIAYGADSGACPHRHRSEGPAKRCALGHHMAAERKGRYGDRAVVAHVLTGRQLIEASRRLLIEDTSVVSVNLCDCGERARSM